MEYFPKLTRNFTEFEYEYYNIYDNWYDDKICENAHSLISYLLSDKCFGIVVESEEIYEIVYSRKHSSIKQRVIDDSIRVHIINNPVILLDCLHRKDINSIKIYINDTDGTDDNNWCIEFSLHYDNDSIRCIGYYTE